MGMKITLDLDFRVINEEILKEYQEHLKKYDLRIEDILEQFLLSDLDVFSPATNDHELAMVWFNSRIGLEYNLGSGDRIYKQFKSDTTPYNEEYIKFLIEATKKVDRTPTGYVQYVKPIKPKRLKKVK